MLINAISFEIHNANQGIHQEFLVENTEDNYMHILAHHYTRQIKFTKVFDFDFARKECVPVSFIELDDEIDSIDEMVGTF